MDGRADCGTLNGLIAQRVNTALFIQRWEHPLRLAGFLKPGTVKAAGLIRTRQTNLARALEEPGRLIKTFGLLHFIDEPAYR